MPKTRDIDHVSESLRSIGIPEHIISGREDFGSQSVLKNFVDVEKEGFQNFLGQSYKALVPGSVSAFQNLAGNYEGAKETMQRAEERFPTKPDTAVSTFLGNAVGSSIPSLAAIAVPELSVPILGYYGLMGAGQGREAVRDLEAATGKDVSMGTELLVATGYGIAQTATEMWGIGNLKRLATEMPEALAKEIGEAFAKGESRKAANLILKHAASTVPKAALVGGSEEGTAQLLTNAIDMAYNEGKRNASGLMQGVGMSTAAGALGEGFFPFPSAAYKGFRQMPPPPPPGDGGAVTGIEAADQKPDELPIAYETPLAHQIEMLRNLRAQYPNAGIRETFPESWDANDAAWYLETIAQKLSGRSQDDDDGDDGDDGSGGGGLAVEVPQEQRANRDTRRQALLEGLEPEPEQRQADAEAFIAQAQRSSEGATQQGSLRADTQVKSALEGGLRQASQAVEEKTAPAEGLGVPEVDWARSVFERTGAYPSKKALQRKFRVDADTARWILSEASGKSWEEIRGPIQQQPAPPEAPAAPEAVAEVPPVAPKAEDAKIPASEANVDTGLFDRVSDFRDRLRKRGVSIPDRDVQVAETGTIYVKVNGVQFRFSDHGQVHAGAGFSVDPESGLSVESAVEKAVKIAKDDSFKDEIESQVAEQENEQRRELFKAERKEIERLGGIEKIRQRLNVVNERLSVKSADGGPSGNTRRTYNAEKKRLEELLASPAVRRYQPKPVAAPETHPQAKDEGQGEAAPTETENPVSLEFAKDRWNSSKLGQKVEWLKRGGFVTKQGQLTKRAEAIAKTKWDDLSPASRNIFIRLIAEDYPSRVEPPAPEQKDEGQGQNATPVVEQKPPDVQQKPEGGSLDNREKYVPGKKLVEYDYAQQKWVTGEAARQAKINLRKQTLGHLRGPNAKEYIANQPSPQNKYTVEEAIRNEAAELADLESMGTLHGETVPKEWKSPIDYPKPEGKPVRPIAWGMEHESKVSDTEKIKTRLALVELDDMITSHDVGLKINPNYPQELQRRDRSRAATEGQLVSILSNFDPKEITEPSYNASEGTPVAGQDSFVESGNVRTIALMRIYQYAPELRDKYLAYLKANAARFGLKPEDVDKGKKPALMRIRISEVANRVDYAEEMNNPRTAEMSSVEKAARDVEHLSDDMLERFYPNEDGEIDNSANRDFIADFMDIVSEKDRSNMINAVGALSADGKKRIKNAVFGKAYGVTQLLSDLIDDDDTNIRNIVNGMVRVTARLIRFNARQKKGTRYPLSISADIVAAAQKLSFLRKNGTSVAEYLKQDTIYDEQISDEAGLLLLAFDKYKRSGKAIGELLNLYYDHADKFGPPGQDSFLGDNSIPSRKELLEAVLEEFDDGGTGGVQEPGLFDQPKRSGAEDKGKNQEGPGGQDAPSGGVFSQKTKDKLAALKEAESDLIKSLTDKGLGAQPFFDPDLYVKVIKVVKEAAATGISGFEDLVRYLNKSLGSVVSNLSTYIERAWDEGGYGKRTKGVRQVLQEMNNETGDTADAAGSRPPDTGATGGKGVRGRPGIRVAGKTSIPPPRTYVRTDSYSSGLDEAQRVGVNLALTNYFDNKKEAFMLADGTGVGKTREILAIADQYRNLTGKKILIITENDATLKGSFANDSAEMGLILADFETGTYDGLRRGDIGKGKYGLVIFDEAHNLKNTAAGKSMAAAAVEADHYLYATATPFDKTTGAAYWLSRVTGVSQEEVERRLGYTTKEEWSQKKKEYVTVSYLTPGHTWATVMDNIVKLREEAISQGAMIRREYPFYGKIEITPHGLSANTYENHRIIEEYWDTQIAQARNPFKRGRLLANKIGEMSRWTEAQKVDDIEKRMEVLLNEGRTVIIVAEGVKGTKVKGLGGEVVQQFLGAMAGRLKMRGIKFAQIFGESIKADEIERLQRGEVRVALMTPQSGGTGVNLDDVVGNRPRTMIIASMNFRGDLFDQIMGRVSRRNTKSEASIEFFQYPDAFSDRRRNEILIKKIQALKAIQSGEDLDRAYGISHGSQASVFASKSGQEVTLENLQSAANQAASTILGKAAPEVEIEVSDEIGVITPEEAAIYQSAGVETGQRKYGQADTGTLKITLYRGASLETAIHEIGHALLELDRRAKAQDGKGLFNEAQRRAIEKEFKGNEEAFVQGLAEYATGKRKATGILKAAFERAMRFLREMASKLGLADLKIEDVFEAILRGETAPTFSIGAKGGQSQLRYSTSEPGQEEYPDEYKIPEKKIKQMSPAIRWILDARTQLAKFFGETGAAGVVKLDDAYSDIRAFIAKGAGAVRRGLRAHAKADGIKINSILNWRQNKAKLNEWLTQIRDARESENLEGLTDAQKAFNEVLNGVFDDVAARAAEVGYVLDDGFLAGVHKIRGGWAKFFPWIMDPKIAEELRDGKKERLQQLEDFYVQMGMSRESAAKEAKGFYKDHYATYFAGIEKPRTAKIPPEWRDPDIIRAIERYITLAESRIAEMRHFGQPEAQRHVLTQMLDQMPENFTEYKERLAKRYFKEHPDAATEDAMAWVEEKDENGLPRYMRQWYGQWVRLVEMGKRMAEKDRPKIIQQIINNWESDPTPPNLNRTRQNGLELWTDLRKAARKELAEKYQNNALQVYLQAIREHGGQPAMKKFESLYMSVFGRPNQFSDILRKLNYYDGNWQMISKVVNGLNQFLQLLQVGRVPASVGGGWQGIIRTLKATRVQWSDEDARAFVENMGVIQESLYDIVTDINVFESGRTRKLARGLAKWSGITPMDSFGRRVQAQASLLYAQECLGGNLNARERNIRKRWLKRWGVDLDEAEKRGHFTPGEFRHIAQRSVAWTQASNNPLDMPFFAQGGWGKIAMRLKRFSYNEARFAYGMLDEFRKGNPMPFLTYLSTLFAGGELYAMLKRLILGEEDQNRSWIEIGQDGAVGEALLRFVDRMAAAGGFGLLFDALPPAQLARSWLGAEEGEEAVGFTETTAYYAERMIKPPMVGTIINAKEFLIDAVKGMTADENKVQEVSTALDEWVQKEWVLYGRINKSIQNRDPEYLKEQYLETTLKRASKSTGRERGEAKKGQKRRHELLKRRLETMGHTVPSPAPDTRSRGQSQGFEGFEGFN